MTGLVGEGNGRRRGSSPPLTPAEVAIFEGEFVGALLACLDAKDRTLGDRERKWVMDALDTVKPEALLDPSLRAMYEMVSQRFVTGEPVDDTTVLSEVGALTEVHPDAMVVYAELVLPGMTAALLPDRARIVVREWKRREFAGLVGKAADALDTGHREDGGRRLAQAMSMRLLELWAGDGGKGGAGYESPDQVVDKLAERAAQGLHGMQGVPLPWPKLNKVAGPLIPGDVVGISAYSNAGKSQLAACMFDLWVGRGQPVIAFPTEMSLQWLERAVASGAGVEQWRAEKRLWKGADEQYERYQKALEEMRAQKHFWQVVSRPNITPAEIVTATRVLRRQWPGQPVVVMVDHMHRLDYGGEDPNKVVGAATKLLHNVAMQDEAEGLGGLIFVLLYQPRKPDQGKGHHGPIAGHQIRGDSQVWNELTIHLSPFRVWVETHLQGFLTPWGTPKAKLAPGQEVPKLVQPKQGATDRKLDDERFWTKVDKRRTGGEGPTVVLEYDPRWGRIYEVVGRGDPRYDPEAAAEVREEMDRRHTEAAQSMGS